LGFSFLVLPVQERPVCACPLFNGAWNYTIPNTRKIMRMMAITIRVWIQLPVFGKLGLMFPPKKPSSHRITNITMIVHNMRFLLL
jgi:hypothetical protein